ncbi:NADH:ubiquinone reductase (Na(+)-transporting) subunit C [Nitratireductor mangrovi]|uniref:Na(+)-translocating NADH-quinone reductase subunit C n=1 Tax=Nitratireductor mangrovi TaxID=2599600 RepID=A0A5B8L7H6_9HYPH|nr:NADH:ubiquinone reductase (Na(+)-transporting) subunit C [Nitratireductor mangrovi]
MTEFNPWRLWKRFLALPNDSRAKTLGVALFVALVCATAVSITAVTLEPLQEANLQRERERRMAEMISALPGMADILRETEVDTLDTVIVNLGTGDVTDAFAPAQFDYAAAQTDPELTTMIPEDADVAGIGRRPIFAPAYLLRDEDRLVLVVIPTYGTGYQSTIRAYVAIKGDLNTIAAVSIYEQGETPGIGTRITDPSWQDRWQGKQIADETGAVRLSVVQGGADGPFEVDAISGATRSSMGVSNLVRFWLGAHGYGPFLERLKARGE